MICNLLILSSFFLLCLVGSIHGFLTAQQKPTFVVSAGNKMKKDNTQQLFMSSFSADGSEYSSKKEDYVDDDAAQRVQYGGGEFNDDDDQDDVETVEEKPVPMSKNSGNRFVAIVWDQDLDNQNRDALTLHEDRDSLIEDHVMFCRKRNLYNETFNKDSMVDILRSLPM